METNVNEKRVKTFIELTRQALEGDRTGQTDLSSRRRLGIDDTPPGMNRRGDHKKKA
jgi:hypothetical protein